MSQARPVSIQDRTESRATDASEQARHSTEATSRRPGAGWQHLSLLCLSLLLLTTSGLALYAFHRVGTLQKEMGHSIRRVEERIQNLDAGINFDSKRQRLLLNLRDEIMTVNPRVSLHEAYEFASLLLNATEKYPTVDPLFFLAIGIVESGYDPTATSGANARGLYQIWPTTGRMLARMLGWEFTEDMLYDPAKNTEMAALYLDVLFTAYNDEQLVLAEYNGGPLNAGYIRAKSQRAAAETQAYVEKVRHVHQRLKTSVERGVVARYTPSLRDPRRNGKTLGERLRLAAMDVSGASPEDLAQ